jgi:hypothetical protein
LNRLTDLAIDSRDYLNPGGTESLEGVRTAITGQNDGHTLIGHKLCGLNAGTTPQGDIRVG